MSGASRYLLGDSRTEQERLEGQAALWDPVTHAFFARIGITQGWRALEIGPGAGSINLELRRRTQRPVDVVEQSPAFVTSLRERWQADGLGDGTVWNAPLIEVPLPAGEYDLVFARWVFLFLDGAERYVARLAAALKPGGVLAVQDYYQRQTFCLLPRPAEWDALVAADLAFLGSNGADPNVAARLPTVFQSTGLDLVDIFPTIKCGGPESAVWEWLSSYYLPMLPRYAQAGPLSPEAADRIRDAWMRADDDPTSWLIGPAMLDVAGRKRR